VEPGELYYVYFPFSYLEEQSYKRRPVLIVGCTLPGEIGDHAALVALITASKERVASPGFGDVIVSDWRKAGLRRPSVIRSRRLWTPEPRDFDRGTGLLGNIDPGELTEILGHVRLLVSSHGS
jgi:hypothetical protein